MARTRQSIAQAANAANNANFQPRRLACWTAMRDSTWELVEPFVGDARVVIVGAGSCDDIPLQRIASRARLVDLVDFDERSMRRARTRISRSSRTAVRVLPLDVTGGAVDVILRAVHEGSLPPAHIDLPTGHVGDGGYDLVIGDMLYTQLLHPGMLSIGLSAKHQLDLMRTWDPQLSRALVERLQRSARRDGRVLHLHDVACWSAAHPQPIPLETAMADPFRSRQRLARHDGCDPHLRLQELGIPILATRWWRWPFEPAKEFLVRATLARGGLDDVPRSLSATLG